MKFLFPFILFVSFLIIGCSTPETPHTIAKPVLAAQLPAPEMKYGFDINNFEVAEGLVEKNQVLSQILSPFGIGASQIDLLVSNCKEVFDVRKIRPNKKWKVLSTPSDSSTVAAFFIYEPNLRDYYVFELNNEFKCWKGVHPTTTDLRFAEGVIEGSLYLTMEKSHAPVALTMELANLYAWTIDFYRIQKGDAFQILYEVELIDDQVVGSPDILAANFFHKDREFEAFSYTSNDRVDFYDNDGGSLRKAFLKAPVKFSRISSKFTKKRFHPVLKRYKSHLGTDYAAPHGTPIVAVADGTVSKSSYTKGNGKYVKIRHNSTYETQYLHMSKRAVNAGDFVKQGDVIGYVGSTGLATGPHVCYRFWKNGKQVDPLSQDLPASDPLPDSLLLDFDIRKTELNNIIDSLRNEVVF
ncbi:MAG: M23 family metallopeptidase [Flavobacteriales bacterium]